MMNLSNVEKIGNTIGMVHKEILNRCSIVGNKYVRFRVEIPMEKPILAGFFQKKDFL